MLGDIASGNTSTADVLFLIAAIVAFIPVVLDLLAAKGINFLAVAICLIAVAFMLL